MIHEVATLTIDPSCAAEFENAVSQARRHFSKAGGFNYLVLQRSIECPQRYLLVVGWDSVEAHTVDFRHSPGFQAWRELVGPFFVEMPAVEHFTTVF